jgi:hypothetical protein
MPVIGVALGLAGLDHHLRRLRTLVAADDVEAFAEAKGLAFHDIFPRVAAPER